MKKKDPSYPFKGPPQRDPEDYVVMQRMAENSRENRRKANFGYFGLLKSLRPRIEDLLAAILKKLK